MVKKQSLKTFIARFYILFVLLLMYAPILVLAVYSFTVSDQLGVWSGFSFQLYTDLVKNKPLMSAVKNTVIIALAKIIAIIVQSVIIPVTKNVPI